jgi:hypothetical protein
VEKRVRMVYGMLLICVIPYDPETMARDGFIYYSIDRPEMQPLNHAAKNSIAVTGEPG